MSRPPAAFWLVAPLAVCLVGSILIVWWQFDSETATSWGLPGLLVVLVAVASLGASFLVSRWTKARPRLTPPVPEEDQRTLEKIARDAIDFVQLPEDADIFGLVGDRLNELVGDCMVAVNSYDPERNLMVTRRVRGISSRLLDKAGGVIGQRIPGLSLGDVTEEAREQLFTGQLVEVEGGIYDLFFGAVPRPVCETLRLLIGIQRVYSIGLRREGKLFGNATILTRTDEPLNRQAVETFVNMISIVIERRQAQEERQALITELERKNRDLEQFTHMVFHDLRSPVVTIKGFLGVLIEDLSSGGTPTEVRAHIDRIARAADTMQLLMDKLQELSQVDLRIGSPTAFPLGEVVEEALESLSGSLKSKAVEVRTAPDLPVVVASRERVCQCLQYLIENSLKFMGDQPRPLIEIGARPGQDEIVCFVADNGVGVEPEHQDLIFDLFKKLDGSSPGIGIGLTIARGIIEAQGGRIWMESRDGGSGSRFCFALPVPEVTRDGS